MGEDMWRLWFTKLLVVAIFLLAGTHFTSCHDVELSDQYIRASRIERNLQGVTTVLLVSAKQGKSAPPIGLLTKTARTFVQDGASTEFATQVVGTTLDNGRLYARILSTSSRVFYDKEPSPDPTSPYVVYPSRAPKDDWQLGVALDNAPIKAIKDLNVLQKDEDIETSTEDQNEASSKTTSNLDELSRENDIFNKRELNANVQRFKPAKVRPAENLPTYTVKQEYVTSSFDALDEEPKSYRPRAPKIFKLQPKASALKKIDVKNFATVTYHGFADFTTTVGDTVIVFSPSTSPVPAGRPATTIKGDATLRPDDGVAVLKIKPTNVVVGHQKTENPRQSKDQFLDAINGGIQSSVPEEVEVESSSRSTDPLLWVPETGSVKATGLLKVIDSTTSSDGTTTHYKSSIYGTFIGTNYAQIIHTSSNVYFFPEESTLTYGTEDTTSDYSTTGTESDDFDLDETDGTTTGTTPRIFVTTEESPMNELTTPYEKTTDSVLTTLKDILESARKVLGTTESAIPMLDDETANDILPVDPQGRSIKGLANRNNLENKNDKGQDQSDNAQKTSLATRLLPSTVYKTFTYFTTFFIPGDNDQTTTSIKSREVISSEVSYLTELILPSATQSTLHATVSPKPAFRPKVQIQAEPEEEQTTKQDEEIELIFKTLYTTYTYLTTFFQESTSSVSSREVVETNIITQTVGANGVSEYDRLFDKEESAVIAPTKIAQIFPSVTTRLPSDTMEGTPTVPNDEEISFRGTTEPTTTENGLEGTTDSSNTEIEPSPTPSLSVEEYQEQVKTYYTTYTYFTTIFVDDETEIETRTEVFSNIVTETIKPTSVLPVPQNTVTSNSKSEESKGAVPPEILAYLEALKRQKSQEEALSLAKKAKPVKPEVQTEKDDYETTTDYFIETTTDNPTTVEDRYTENSYRDFNVQVTPNPPVEGEVLGSMITDVVSTSSSGGGTVLEVMDKRNAVPEDQELSESNHHDVEPAPTLLLQTSYTTFTYFTTMYKGEESNVVSRLETVTNVATETIRPTAVVLAETSTLPVTYFTTFTYWTTFYRGGDTVTTSREETISNVVTPGVSATPTVQLGVIMTYRPSQSSSPFDDELVEEKESKATADNEVTPADRAVSEKAVTQETPTLNGINTRPSEDSAAETSLILPEPTTYYTTFTYFTTSYIGNETILNSRLETVTSVSRPEAGTPQATGRAIGTSVPPLVQALDTESKSVRSSKTEDVPKTGLISTIRSSNVQDGTTTHYATDVYGTYIDGLYAQVVESSTRLETSTPSPSSVATPILPTGVLSLNKGSVIDADEVTTVYFTTKQIGTLIDGLYAKVIESTSSTKIDEERKATLPPPHGHRTGLVRLIQGNIENNGTTTFYQSKVIGTSIDGRYAQIIESTSTFVAQTATKGVSPSSTIPPNQATGVPAISPSPAAIQSSLSEDHSTDSTDDESEENEGEESEEEDEEGGLGKKKSRLTFSSRKRTFTPVIRPFISRNRPTFNPKRKGAQGATTITRTDITPTITATLAGKSNRFASSRGRVTSPVGPYSSTLAPSGSRRFSGRRSSVTSSSVLNTASAGSTRGRQAARIAPSSVFQGNRRTPTSIRGSSSRGSIRGSSSAFPVASSRYRPGIRPSSTLLRGQSTAKHEDQEDDANEFTTTTLTTEETPFTEFTDAGETTPYQTTTESSRRSTNPLLRFRRPLNTRPSTTPRPSTTTAPRRTGNLNRQTPPTVPNRAANARSNNRVPTPIASRTRTGNTGLFPPRSLFGRKQVETPVEETTLRPDVEGEEKHESHIEDHPVEEISDNDYEGSEHEDRATTTANVTRRSGKSLVSPVQIRPFGRPRRTRRQASQLRQLTNRFRSTTPKFEERSDIIDSSTSREEFPKTYAKPTSRYSVRGRSLTTSRSSSSESAEVSQQNQSRPRTNSSRVKPSPITASNRQFTLREKDGSTTNRSGYKRPSTTSRSRTPSKSTDRNRSLRLTGRNGSDSRRGSSRGSSRSSGRSNNNRRLNHRGRGSYENIRESPLIYPDTDGTITVTHYVPTDVTIPVVSNGVTEQRNIITARPSTEILGPEQYSTVVGGDGRPLVVIVSEATGTNNQGQTEITRFLLHETPTTRISHTLTTLGGRRASQSVIVPSTVYSVENIVSTIHPSIPGNSPLANILLSQLLLGQLGQQNPLGTSQASPTTQYSTRTTSYVTTITKQQSTVIPLTFRGKEILTTLVDTSTNVVTATEFITDTVVVTPTAAIPQANLNSLLLLLQQPQSQQQPNPLADPLFAASPLTQSNTLPGEVERRNQPADFDYRPDSYEYSEEEDDSYDGTSKSRSNRKDKKEKKATEKTAASAESSVVTLYVSGRRPGEFSTVLSTVKIGDESTVSRRRRDILGNAEVRPSVPPSLHAGPDPVDLIAGSEQPIHAHAPTQSLESVVGEFYEAPYGDRISNRREIGNYNRWSASDDYDTDGIDVTPDTYAGEPRKLISANGTPLLHEFYAEEPRNLVRTDGPPLSYDVYPEEPRKRVRIRVPVTRTRTGRQHKYTVVRRRTLVPYQKETRIKPTSTPRRIVVTRVRSLGPIDDEIETAKSFYDDYDPALYSLDDFPASTGRHKVTITRRRKVQATSIEPTSMKKVRITRKKLVNVRPVIQPTPTIAIITTGFYTAPSLDDYDNYNEEKFEDDTSPTVDINLKETPNNIDFKAEVDNGRYPQSVSATRTKLPDPTTTYTPVIITDNFFLPPFNEEEDYDDTTTTGSPLDITTMKYQKKNFSIPIYVAEFEETTAGWEDKATTTSLSTVNEEVENEEDLLTTTVTGLTTESEETIMTTRNFSDADEETTTKLQETVTNPPETQGRSSTESSSAEEVTTDRSLTETLTETDKPTEANKVDLQDEDVVTIAEPEDALTVIPIQPYEPDLSINIDSSSSTFNTPILEKDLTLQTISTNQLDDSDIPSVIPLGAEHTIQPIESSSPVLKVTTTIASPTPEDIEAGLADDLYLSLSRQDFLEILPSKPISNPESATTSYPVLEPSTSVYYTETVVTSTRLRTYTYVVTKFNGLETQVTSSTTVRPRVTTLTLTVPVTVTVTPSIESSSISVSPVNNPEPAVGEHEARDEEEGRRFNLATRVMSNGVEVIVAGPTPALRWENSNPQPTLTLSDAVVMLLPQDKPNEFVTKTCTTTFTYLSTITKDGTTIISTEQQVIANTATEERHRKHGSETAAVTLEASPTLRTEVFKTTYTYLTLNTDHKNVEDALESSTKVITNTVTAPQHYLDMILEPSEAPRPETNTYLSTRILEKTFMEDGRTKITTTTDTVTQLIVTESVPPPRPTSVTTTLTALDNTEDLTTDIMKTYYITYTYYNMFLENGSTVVRTNIATSTDVVLEKAPIKKTATKTTMVNQTPEPIQIFATKTYLTTFTYFTTLLQAGANGETSTTISSRSHIVENVVTESIAPSLLDAGYMSALMTTAHHSDPVKNVVTGSTIIFFDEEDQIDATKASTTAESTATVAVETDSTNSENVVSSMIADAPASVNTSEESDEKEEETTLSSSETHKKKPVTQSSSDLQVSNLLSLGSLGINSLSALGPVITAMAGLLQGKPTATRRNDTVAPNVDAQETTTQRAPIYIPVAEFADGDIETAESQHIVSHLVNHNYIAETRHKVASSLADGIPISPGEIITANSDVIIGKPGKMGPRPPQIYSKDEGNLGMKPPPLPVPNIPVHPVLEVIEDDQEDSQGQHSQIRPQIQILPAHQIYEEHLKIPVTLESNHAPNQPQKLQPVGPLPPRIGSKQDILENDPLLKPPNRPNVEQYVNPNKNLKISNWNLDKHRRPWSAKDPLNPQSPASYDEVHYENPVNDNPRPVEVQKRPPWAEKDPLLPETSLILHSSEPNTLPSEPIVYQVPHVIDRSQPLLVNIQPSQMANVVIPPGGTQALIFGDTNEPHISGQYFDDPSPYPEPEIMPGKAPSGHIASSSAPINFKVLSPKNGASRPHTIPLSSIQLEGHYGRPEKPEIHLIKRPDSAIGSSGQGHVHTEILVHHRPESINIRPQSIPRPTIVSHVHTGHQGHQHPPRGDGPNHQKQSELATPPRRTEVPLESSHKYIFLNKPDNGEDVALNNSWKSGKKPPRINIGSRPRLPRPPIRPTTIRPNYGERPSFGLRKPIYQRPPSKTQGVFPFQQHPPSSPHQGYHESTRKPISPTSIKQVFNGRPHVHNIQSHLVDSASHEDKNEDHLPTGTMEYHNPLDSKAKLPENNLFFESSSPETKVPDYEQISSNSEHVFDHEYAGSEHSMEDTDKPQTNNFEAASTNGTIYIEQPYKSDESISTVIGKPLKVEQGISYGNANNKTPLIHKGEPFNNRNDEINVQIGSFGQGYDNVRPYDTPIVQGKPFGVYNGQVNLSVPYGFKRNDNKPDYDVIHGSPIIYYGDKKPGFVNQPKPTNQTPVQKLPNEDDTIDLRPPAIIPQFNRETDNSNRPYLKSYHNARPDKRPSYPRPEIITKAPEIFDTKVNYNMNGHVSDSMTSLRNKTLQANVKTRRPQYNIPGHKFYNETTAHPSQSNVGATTHNPATRVHHEYPNILTKPKPKVPAPITISTGIRKSDLNKPNIQYSLSVESTGEEKDSKTQTERPPSMLITKHTMKNNKKPTDETLETAYQTNFALPDSEDEDTEIHEVKTKPQQSQSTVKNKADTNVPSRDMRPPPLRPAVPGQIEKQEEQDLKPPPLPSTEVVGLSPPPVDITTTNRPTDNRFNHGAIDDSDLKPPPKYIPLKESNAPAIPPPPSTSMVPPSLRPTVTRPFLVELLSQDMVPSTSLLKTTKPLEIATIRPAVAVSGSIQIATAVATSHIPVINDMESKIPIIHGTVDLPVIIDVPEIMRPVETKMTEHVSIYTVRPFDTKPISRPSVQPTSVLTTNLVISTKLRSPQLDQIQPSKSSASRGDIHPTEAYPFEIPQNPVKRPENPIFLESSDDVLPPNQVEATETLTYIVGTNQQSHYNPTMTIDKITKTSNRLQPTVYRKKEHQNQSQSSIVTRVDSSISKVTNTVLPEKILPNRRNETSAKTKGNASQVTHHQHGAERNSTLPAKPKEVTRFKTSTVTRVETSVLGSPPTTRTLLITHTMTSTTVETVTETLLRPTNVVATVTSTIVQSITKTPTAYDNIHDNDSIFIVMSDQKPPAPGAEEVEAEYGDEDISRDEQDPAGNEIHRVLAGGVLGAPVVPIQSATSHCIPECKANKAEICAEIGNEMRCVCRPGFARMFPDRPCKPTYTYTLKVGLDRIGHELVDYEIAMNDITSVAYQRIANPIKEALDRTMMQSDLRDVYRGLKIAGFSPDPTKVEFHVQLSDNTNEKRLKEVIRKYLMSGNFSLGGTDVYASKNLDLVDAKDFNECGTEEGGPHHDCSPHAACFNLRGTYQCSCKEGWADLSENPAYPGRVCSQAPLGCAGCNNKGHCVTNIHGQEVCECFPWYSGQRCQVNLKVLLIALVTTGAILLGLLAVCVGLACFRRPSRRAKAGDRRAMILGANGGDTSSEGSVTDLAIPHHVPHILPPPPKMLAPLPPTKRPVRKISAKPRQPPKKATTTPSPVPVNEEQRDRSLTVMIPRAKYRSVQQAPQSYKSGMSTFATEEHKLMNYLENGPQHSGVRKQSVSSNKDCKEADLQIVRAPVAPSGALVSAGFQVSATVTRIVDAESTLARSCDETSMEASTKVLRADLQGDLGSTLARSCGETTIHAPTKLLRLDLGEAGSTLARSCGETTIQPPTKLTSARRNSIKDSRDNRDTRDSASEGHTMAERDLGSTLRLPAQHPPLYSPDRASDRESNFDSL